VAVGTGAQATGTNTTAIGDNAEASGNFSTAIGNNAKATATNSVALGNGSVADQANTVSVGAVGSERRITNIARGTGPNDAVNYGQFLDGINGINGRIGNIANAAYRGTAIAMATTPNPIVLKPGQYSITTGYGHYRGQDGLGLNLSRFSEDGHSALNLGVGYSPQGGGAAVRGSMSYVLGD
jgi:autotransporter adhesin